jgi:2-succinyl-5-enolpyruvyl-6-hydroxy-3-cyclohexene-1-carboxylate synthase
MHLDERSAGYFALGMARALGEPVALLATSGTAVVNFAPAVAEARYGRVPLVVLTADRPHELRDAGAAQTIDQVELYGSHAKWACDMPLPEATDEAARNARVVAARAVATARVVPAGPVQVNFPFREPLIPSLEAPFEGGGAAPAAPVLAGARVAPAAEIERLAAQLRAGRRGVIVCGPEADAALVPAVAPLARATGWPVLADALSGLRCGGHDRSHVIAAYDAFLRDADIMEELAPDVVLRFGALPTSKPLAQYLERHAGARHVLFDDGGWRDPLQLATDVWQTDGPMTAAALAAAIGGARGGEWLETWRRLDDRASAAIATALAREGTSEPGVVRAVADALPYGATLFAGNSMPVRDVDTFFPSDARRVRFMANRGVSGIDGVVSSALGAAVASAGPLVLLIGDLSFYHDMNGLLAAKKHGVDATIVLVNNDGGGIFSFLPQAELDDGFDELFGTPHGIDFAPVAQMYGVGFARAADDCALRRLLRESIGAAGVQVIEVRTDREENVALHRDVWAGVSRVVREQLHAD